MKNILQKRIIPGFIINVIIVILLGLVSYEKFENDMATTRLEEQKGNISFHTEKIKAVLCDVENSSKEYLLSGNPNYLLSYNQKVFSIGAELEDIASLSLTDSWLAKYQTSISSLVDKSIDDNNLLIEIKKEGKSSDFGLLESGHANAEKVAALLDDVQHAENNFYLQEKRRRAIISKELRIAFNALQLIVISLLVTVYFIVRTHLRERRNAESKLEKSEALLKSIMDNSSNAIFVKQLNGQYLIVNRRFEKLFHYANEELVGKTDHQVFTKDVADNLRSSDLDVIKNEKEITIEEKFTHDGDVHTYLMVKFPIRDNENKIYAIGAIATDITERKKNDVLIKSSEAQVSLIFNAAPEAVIVIDEESKIMRWNTRAETLFGWKASEVIGKQMPELIMPARFRELHYQGLKNFLKTGEGPILNRSIDLSAINKNNVEFDMELTTSAILQEGKYIFVAFMRDVTKKKQMERHLKESETFLASIFDNIPDMIFVKDAKELRFVKFNPAGEKLLGYPSSELIGKNDYNFFPKEEADAFTNKDREVISSGKPVDIPAELIDTRNGKRWLHTRKIVIKDEKGQPTYLLGISSDITEAKALEEKKEKAENMLKENRETLKLILENIGEGVIVTDPRKKILLANHTADEILKIEKDENLAFDWTDHFKIFYNDGVHTFPSQELPLEKALRNEPTDNLELVLVDPETNESKIISVTGRPIKNDKNAVVAGVATLRDITKMKEIERTMNESEKKYRNAIGFKRKAEE